jgi:uncharacterized membrane protein (UPF0127 family)
MRGWIALVIALSLVPADRITGPQPTLPQSALMIETKRGPARFTIELATTPEQQQHGLMFRSRLAPDAGMLFLYGTDRPHSFWVKNTLIPLDILFVKADGVIARIAANTKPLSEEQIPSGEPVRAVLEIPGGRATQLSVAVGDKVRHSGLEN